MKKQKLINILEEEFPVMAATPGDFIGEQVKINEEIRKVIVTLDVTLDVINQSIINSVDLIISHHPLFFGDKNELMKKDKILKSKYELLLKKKIGVFVIHTNADFNPNSIAYMQGLAINLMNIEQNSDNLSIFGELKEEMSAKELSDLIKRELELTTVEFRSNFNIDYNVKKILISSGAGGSEIDVNNSEVVNIIGEVKHHEWVMANERGLKVLEISHFSEKIFKSIVKIFLEKESIKVILSEEENGYKII